MDVRCGEWASGKLAVIGWCLAMLLVGCGGGAATSTTSQAVSTTSSVSGGSSSSGTTGVNTDAAIVASAQAITVPAKPASRVEAARFLTQATFGPTDADIDHLMSVGYQAWIQEQLQAPLPGLSHQGYVSLRDQAIKASNPGASAGPSELTQSFWAHAIAGPDQLRQRVAFALSEIFVVSMADSCGSDIIKGTASYLDMLGQQAFGTYRQLLESVALHPIMGCYLSHLHNEKEDPVTGRVPDENFAREVMQLFSIGLYQLKDDGTQVLDSQGQPIETYGVSDISGMAKVFTGWSWRCPASPSDACFFWGDRPTDHAVAPDRYTGSMVPYAQFHSTSEKRFLGITIAPQSSPDPAASLKAALDALNAHPNVGPFIGRQLIQRLVTSNPSPAYVQRVAAAFRQSGGRMDAMITAILLDPQARDMSALSSNTFGKVREPILRLSAMLRAMGAHSDTGSYLIGTTDDPATALGQSPLKAPSVFNFFRPGYVPAGSKAAGLGLVAPEMQLVHEASAAGYVNFMEQIIWSGIGWKGFDGKATRADVQMDYAVNPQSRWLALAQDPAGLVERLNQSLMYGAMPASLKTEIVDAVSSIDFRSATPTADEAANTWKYRVWSALLLTVASPEFQIQK